MLPASEVLEQLRAPGLGFERVEKVDAASYRDSSTVIVCPTRGMVHHRVVASFMGLIPLMNQKRAFFLVEGAEVGRAYDDFVRQVLAEPTLSTWKYLMSVEDDCVLPADAHVRLLEAIELGPFDGVGGIYFTKGDLNMPMAYGDPAEYARTGVLDFRPRDVTQALREGRVMEVNGIAMGCSLYRMDLFRQVPPPWFVTVNDVDERTGAPTLATQDLAFCSRARRAGKRFGVDMRCRVGHLQVETGELY